MAKRAIVVIDLQNEYLSSGKLPLAGIDDAVANAARVIAAARAAGETILHIRHENPADAPVFATGTPNVAIIPAVAPREGESVLLKHRPNGFHATELKAVLDATHIEEVVVIGAMSHMCIDATSRAARDFGFAVTVVHDACATRNLDFGGRTVPAADVHAAFMAALAFAYGQVISTDAFLAH